GPCAGVIRLERLLPVIADVVEAVDARLKLAVSGARPTVLVKARRVLEFLLRDIQHEAVPLCIERHRLPGNGEELVAHAEKTAEREDAVGNAPCVQVDHVVVDISQMLARGVDDSFVLERARGENLGTFSDNRGYHEKKPPLESGFGKRLARVDSRL